jgi:hypothetical protein
MPPPLLILGLPHSGTTCVERAIAQTAGIVAPGEPFHGTVEIRTTWAKELRPWREGTCPLEWIRQTAHAVAPARLVSKVLYSQLSPQHARQLLELGDCVLCRRHPLWQYVSLEQAVVSNVWNRLRDGRDMFGYPACAYEPRPVVIQRGKWEQHLAQWRAAHEVWQQVARRIDYPALLKTPGEVCAELAARFQLAGTPAIVTEKLHLQPLCSRIANWQDVQAWVNWEEFAELDETDR